MGDKKTARKIYRGKKTEDGWDRRTIKKLYELFNRLNIY